MAILVLGAAAALTVFVASPQTPAPDPAFDTVFGDQAGEPRALRQRMLAERREPAWATPAEAKLRPLYTAIPAMRALTVTCRKTLCEVVGELPSSEAMSIGLVQVIPSKAPLDLDLLNLTFSIAEREPGTVTYVTYWLRHPA